MAFKTFVDGVALPASDINTYLAKQAVVVCTAATHPSSPPEGMTIYETDTDKVLVYSGSACTEISRLGAYTSYTPTLGATTTNPTLGSGSSATGSYIQWGKLVIGQGQIVFGSSGTGAGSGNYWVSLPVTPKAGSAIVGHGTVFDSSASSLNTMELSFYSGTSNAYIYVSGAGASYITTNANPWTWAASDSIRFSFNYEAA